MSDTDSSSSTDSDNNNASPFFNRYLGYPHGFNYNIHVESSPNLETDSSSDSEIIPNSNHLYSSSSDVSFQNLLIIYFISISIF